MSTTSNHRVSTESEPAGSAAAITPSDSDDLPGGIARAIRCTGDCTLKVTTRDGSTVTLPFFKGDNPIAVRRVFATGTTLGGETIYALW